MYKHMHVRAQSHTDAISSRPIRQARSLVADRKIMQQPMLVDRGDI